jgi:hypothetical protein
MGTGIWCEWVGVSGRSIFEHNGHYRTLAQHHYPLHAQLPAASMLISSHFPLAYTPIHAHPCVCSFPRSTPCRSLRTKMDLLLLGDSPSATFNILPAVDSPIPPRHTIACAGESSVALLIPYCLHHRSNSPLCCMTANSHCPATIDGSAATHYRPKLISGTIHTFYHYYLPTSYVLVL